MSERCQGSVRCNPEDLQEALSIHTRKITDSCRDKDCIEDLRVYLTRGSQAILDGCAGAKVRCADLLYTYIDVETDACQGWKKPPVLHLCKTGGLIVLTADAEQPVCGLQQCPLQGEAAILPSCRRQCRRQQPFADIRQHRSRTAPRQ